MVTKITKQRLETEAYLHRLAVSNEVFGDHIRIEGKVHFPDDPREHLVTTQPLVQGRRSTLSELDSYMRRHGFKKAMDGLWHRNKSSLWVGDVLEKNAITDVKGHVHLIDFTLPHLSEASEERYLSMLHAQPQPDPPPLVGRSQT